MGIICLSKIVETNKNNWQGCRLIFVLQTCVKNANVKLITHCFDLTLIGSDSVDIILCLQHPSISSMLLKQFSKKHNHIVYIGRPWDLLLIHEETYTHDHMHTQLHIVKHIHIHTDTNTQTHNYATDNECIAHPLEMCIIMCKCTVM